VPFPPLPGPPAGGDRPRRLDPQPPV